MKMNLKIKTRILLGVGVLGMEFMVFLVVVQWCARQTQVRMQVASQSQFPAAVGLQQAEAAFQRLEKRYADAVVMQDKSAIGQSAQDADTVLAALDTVVEKSAYSSVREQQVRQVREQIATTEPKAREAYTAMMSAADSTSPAGAMTDAVQAEVKDVAQAHKEIEGELKSASDGVADDFSEQLASVSTLTMRQSILGWVITVFAVLCGAVVMYFIDRKVSRPLAELVERVQDIASGDGDLTKRLLIGTGDNDEIGEASHWFNTFMDKLQQVILRVLESSEQLTGATKEIANSAVKMAKESQVQRERMQMMAISMQQMSESVAHISTSANAAAGNAIEAGELAKSGGETAQTATVAMHRMEESSVQTQHKIEEVGQSANQIGRIVSVIDEIAGRTNLLALNATIEAARAGEHGRGFAVVAGEVRELAVRTTSATAEISQMVATIQSAAQGAVEAMRSGTERVGAAAKDVSRTSEALQMIITKAGEVQSMVTTIATATTEQSATAKEINHSMEEMSGAAEMSATTAAASSSGCSRVAGLAQGLRQMVEIFKVGEGKRAA